MNPVNKRIEAMQAILIAILAALILRQFVIAAYKIPTSSMEDTLLVGDFLLVNKFVYGATSPDWIGIPFTRWKDWGVPTGVELPAWLQFRLPALAEPVSGDVLVFRYPEDTRLDFIKRCIATSGQTVQITNKQVFVDGNPLPDPPGAKHIDDHVLPRDQHEYLTFRADLGSRDNFGPLQVEPEQFFMMGDNRDNSSDSRQWGFVPRANLIGKPLIIYLSISPKLSDAGILDKIRWNRLGMVVR